jgi:hypothetical protein
MKSGGACVGELFALAMLAATPACSERVPVATISDAGIDAMPMTACGALDGGTVGCPDGSFCSLYSCGSTGQCETIPPADSCGDAGYAPECDCYGVTYFNGCLRRVGTSSLYKTSACPDPLEPKTNPNPKVCIPSDVPGNVNPLPCDPGESCVQFLPFPPSLDPDGGFTREFCATIESSHVQAPGLLGTCWVLPETCSPSGTHFRSCADYQCVDACEALKKKGPLLTCP